MDRSERYALDAAKEITIAKMSCSNIGVGKEAGECVAAFYEEIFKKIRDLSKSAED